MSRESKKLSRITILKDRAQMLTRARNFFSERSVLEVDCACLSQRASVDAHIDLIPATCFGNKKAFLHSSPEYPMKRLLAEGIGDIYQLSHVFRDGEVGAKHNLEFMMAEWYRLSFSLLEMIEETQAFVALFLGERPKEVLSYRDAFRTYANLDPFEIELEILQERVKKIDPSIQTDDRDDLLNYILAIKVEPHLGKECYTALTYYPPSQAALAKTCMVQNHLVAERFEIYHQGVELANGYHELQDAKEQLNRLHEANRLRKALGKNELPIDMHFIEALQKGLPDCSGVAVGFDRLMMLRHSEKQIAHVIPFGWETA